VGNNGWEQLLASALIGTDRRGAATDEAARALLDEAAALTAYRRAGMSATRDIAAPIPAPDETLPLVGATAAAHLFVLTGSAGVGWAAALTGSAGLAGGDPAAEPFPATIEPATRLPLLAEWLAMAVGRGRRVPPERLPELFDIARREPTLRQVVVAAAGARASWLAGLNPDWTFLTATVDEARSDDPATWDEGTAGQRAGYLAARRRADPGAARDLLARDWSGLASDERATLLPMLQDQLGPADEAFLEQALDDRHREVRSVAATLLALLPGSAYQERMARQARMCLSVQNGRLVVTPPTAVDAVLCRDGVEPRPPARIGERAWWLRQILARAPLPETVASPELLSTMDEWADEALRGLARAAANQHHPAWAAVLLDQLGPRIKPGNQDWPLVPPLYRTLAPDERERRTISALAADAGPARWMLADCPGPWPDPLSTAALSAFESAARRGQSYSVAVVAHIAGLRMAPTFAEPVDAVAARLRAENSDHVDPFDRLAALLRLRHVMIEELQ
jgi:hypothetical protein